jgi:Flp pilus assembly protein TadG
MQHQDGAAAAAAAAAAAGADDAADASTAAAAAAAEGSGAVVMGGMKQDEQERVLQEFRDGSVQVLLATCIGEEGLDVPQVRVQGKSDVQVCDELLAWASLGVALHHTLTA